MKIISQLAVISIIFFSSNCLAKGVTPFRESETIRVSKKKPEVTLIEEAQGFGDESWFLGSYDPNFLKLKKYRQTENGTVEWIFRIDPKAFLAPHLLKVTLLMGDPDNMESSQYHHFYLVTSSG